MEKMAKTTIKELENKSICVETGMTVVYPQFFAEETMECSWVPKFNGCYAVNNSTVAFVNNEKLFVTPYTRNVIKVLEEVFFKEEYFCVPFSNWDYPKLEKERWNKLKKEAKLEEENACKKEFIDYCEKHDIMAIDEKVLENCFVMPVEGIHVETPNFEHTYYPIIKTEYLTPEAFEYLGTYCTNNGKVVFVYQDGKTYVTKGYKILTDLEAAGYREKGLFVPFSNGERIVDPDLAAKWDNIKRIKPF